MTVHVHIERVVLHGLAAGPADRERWRRQLEHQLACRLAALPPQVWTAAAGATSASRPVTERLVSRQPAADDGHPPAAGLPPAPCIAAAVATALAGVRGGQR
ncbi:MAG TPA: hypothetical protein VKP11_10450 [Frankiaceae bacterium]|nr:hypothetical protein [Frankiaceae bacterium]